MRFPRKTNPTNMAKKKKHDFDDWEDAPDDAMVAEGNGDQFQVHLSDYVIEEKVSAFQRAYKPCNEFDPGYEAFDEARLRDFFKANVCGLGDPLKLYIEDLKLANFRMDVSRATGELCIFVMPRS